jgi:hypothetical protein
MAYNLHLAERIRSQLDGLPFVEKKMFGGVGYLLHGNMVCGVVRDDLVVRVDPEKYDSLLKKSHTRVFDMTGRQMKGWLLVGPEGVKTEKQLRAWIDECLKFTGTLSPK